MVQWRTQVHCLDNKYRQTHLKRTLTGIVAASMVLGTMAPVALASTSSSKYTWSTRSISENGQAISALAKVPGFTYDNTYYISVYDVQYLLNQFGAKATWDNGTLNITTSNTVDTSKLPTNQPSNANAFINVNGKQVFKGNHIVLTPPGGKFATSFMQVYDLQQVLNALGYDASGYNGAAGTWNILNGPSVGNVTGKVNSDDTVTVTGTDANADFVTVSVDGGTPANATLNSDGTFTYKTAALGIGSHSISVVAYKGTTASKAATASVTVAAPAVQSVKALNLKQVQVYFNKPVDSTTAGDISNYGIYTSAGGSTNLVAATGTADVQSDDMSVILTLATGQTLTNNGTFEATVSGVKDQAGNKIADYDQSGIAVSDTTAPTVTGVTATGPRTIQVTFSEPVKSASSNLAGDFAVDNGNYVVSSATASGDTVTVVVGAPLTDGSHTIAVNSGTTDLEDYASLPVAATSKSFSVTAVTTAPTVSIASASQTKVVLKFSAPVSEAAVSAATIYGVYNNATYGDVATPSPDTNATTYSDGTTTYADTYDLSFASPLPTGTDAFYINNNTSTPIVDAWGNKVADTTLSASIANDTTAPTVTSATIAPNAGKTAHTVTVVFSKDVKDVSGAAPGTANVVLKNSDGTPVSLSLDGYNASTDTLTLDTTAGLLPGGTYTLTVQNLEDTTPNENKLATYTATINVPNIIPPTATATYKTTGKSVEVSYSTAMSTSGTSSIANAANYQVVGNGASSADPISAVKVLDDKDVVLTLENALPAGDPTVSIQNVTDTNNNPLKSFGADSITASADNGALVTSVKAISTSEVQVTFDRALTGFSAAGWSFDDATSTPSASADTVGYLQSVTTNSDGDSVVTLHLATPLHADATDGTANLELEIGSGNTAVDALGVAPQVNTPATSYNPTADAYDVVDAIAPTLTSVAYTNATTLTLTFSEALDTNTFATNTANGFSVSGGGTLTSVSVSGDQVTITGTGFVQDSTQVSYNSVAGVADLAGNKLASFSGQVAK
ncbi:Ig-like domain-containing protein [Alicyclobacillus cycloheptanicus]|uniref:SbsA Ig-like domain-containing protein n=1 Tax=Alicyclobacillus cycloheptanicus TaxID=1457 RepID=A0ABT9XMN7_9BACL|nr:Ig-like domain-containing protein [Alicyclobacillus cycloheptanicus]MDQ0191586.1 hypothetical protein [Alicyclobacillus cycloheptanicus]WDM02219.1 Ig-like domain-containing protein [Alicyclobacillus cycloheptanicus]